MNDAIPFKGDSKVNEIVVPLGVITVRNVPIVGNERYYSGVKTFKLN